MEDKEVKIKVSTEAEIEPLEELDETLEDIQDKTEVNLEVDSDSVDDAKDKTDELSEGLDDVDDAEPSIDVDDGGVDDAAAKLDELIEIMDEINDKIIAPDVDTSNIEKANEDLEETESSIGGIKTTLVGLVATAEIEHMATVADNMNTSWNRLQLTFEGTGVSMDILKDKVSAVNAETSRGAGAVRDYFNMMGVAGVTNVDLLAASFESLSGKAYQLDSDIGSLESKMQTMVLTGNASEKMLKSLGLTAGDLAAAIGVSVDELSDAFDSLSPEQRLQAITNAMGDGAVANQMYGDSYEAMKNKADAAMSGLEGAVGQAILPTVIPALDTATQMVKGLTEGFKNLPAPVQNAIGTTMGVAAIATTGIGMFGDFAGAIANLGDAYGVLKGVYKALIPTQYAEGTAGWFSIGWIAAAILLGIALGLALIYLYENCDWFREAVDNLANALSNLVNFVFTEATNNLTMLAQQFEEFTNQLGLDTDNWIQAITAFILFLPTLPARLGLALADSLARAAGFKGSFVSYITTAASDAVNGFISWVVGMYNKFKEEVDAILAQADRLARELPPKIAKAGLGVLGNWINTTGESSPGYMYDAFHGELVAMQTVADRFSSMLPKTISETGRDMVGGFGTPTLSAVSNDGIGGSQVINLNLEVGTVDSDDRVQEIVDVIRRELNWNNVTAGRTV